MSTSLKKLAADQAVPVKKTDLFLVALNLLVEEKGFNLRDYGRPETEASIEGFKNAYLAGHYVPPLVVYTNDEGQVVIVEGHKRRLGALRAVKAGAPLEFLQCVEFRGNAAQRTALMIRSANGEHFTPLQLAFGALRLKGMLHTNSVVAAEMGVKPQRVEQLLILATAETDVHELVRSDAVKADVAIEVIRKHGTKAGEFLRKELEAARAQGKNKVTKKTIQGWTPPRKVVTSLVGSFDTFTSKLSTLTRQRLAQLEKMDASQVKGKVIEVDAAALLELVRAQAELDESRTKHDSSVKAKQQAESQGDLIAAVA